MHTICIWVYLGLRVWGEEKVSFLFLNLPLTSSEKHTLTNSIEALLLQQSQNKIVVGFMLQFYISLSASSCSAAPVRKQRKGALN